MTIAEMLEQSAVLTVLGMAIVFAFLWLMIICMNVTAKLIRRFGLDKDVNPDTAPKKADSTKLTMGTAKPEITAAITAAVTEYRKNEEG